ncbi:VCBS repeat protein [Streptomyces sp. SLBN-118]|uniref:FG-GAP repeat domain-containing protein n=1 Tax=Streptomyces sp. SLBN-118 TaxID=2768454 RepID=UPI001150FB8A|nr:VCBS repeat-containing protein [Streptomyces sp. SLBN-118]TQK51786.1 VCBS repeat protein [Streptomyces sp. SLBN-118]
MFRHLSRPVCRAVIYAVGFAIAITTVLVARAAPPFRDDRADNAAAQATQAAPGPVMFPLFGRKAGRLYDYEPKGTGGVKPLVDMGGGWAEVNAFVQANVSENGTGNDLYHRTGTTLYYTAEHGNDSKVIGGGWDQYSLLVSVGNMGGATDPDIVARHTDGTLWLYQGKADGSLVARIRIGTAGWNGMNALAGRGDYTGDGKADLIARGTDGTLYIYPGTGNAAQDAALGSRITVGKGWEAYKSIVSSGDNDGDGKTDLIASDSAGSLWLFKGTGNATAPFAPRVQIGTSGWGSFDTLF